MRQDIKERWVTALRSGEYKQGTGKLHRVDNDGTEAFCCLGVLCDIVKDEVDLDILAHDFGDSQVYSYDGNSGYPEASVSNYVGMDNDFVVTYRGERKNLFMVNDDHRASFDEIADLIENQF